MQVTDQFLVQVHRTVAGVAQRSVPHPLDAAVLGMGNDGHTASFFPGGDTLAEALSGEGPVIAIRAPGAGEPRVTGLPASAVKKLPDGDLAIALPKGATVELTAPGAKPGIVAVPITAGQPNPFGLPAR